MAPLLHTCRAAGSTYYLLLAPCYLLLTTYYSLLTTHYLLLTTYYSLLTTHYSLLTTYYTPAEPLTLLPVRTIERRTSAHDALGNVDAYMW